MDCRNWQAVPFQQGIHRYLVQTEETGVIINQDFFKNDFSPVSAESEFLVESQLIHMKPEVQILRCPEAACSKTKSYQLKKQHAH